MYFVSSGEFDYTRETDTGESVLCISYQQWVSEMALWCSWEHCGQMQSTIESSVIHVEAEALRAVVSGSKMGQREVALYAVDVIRFLQDISVMDLSDVESDLHGFD